MELIGVILVDCEYRAGGHRVGGNGVYQVALVSRHDFRLEQL